MQKTNPPHCLKGEKKKQKSKIITYMTVLFMLTKLINTMAFFHFCIVAIRLIAFS